MGGPASAATPGHRTPAITASSTGTTASIQRPAKGPAVKASAPRAAAENMVQARDGAPSSHPDGLEAAPPPATRRASAPAVHPAIEAARARMAGDYGRDDRVLISPHRSPIVPWGEAMNRIAAVSLLALTPVLAHADSVFLKNGGEIKGEIVEQREDAVVMEVGPGRLTVPRRNVARIVTSTTDLGVFNARAAALSSRDVEGWLDLAAWAQAHGLGTQAREAYGRVLAAQPFNATAHLALGHVLLGDQWLDAADANRARGLVEFQGAWMSPEERRERIAEERAGEIDRQAAREAEARAREAEARVREAEARARTAEADAQAAAEQPVIGSGIPYPYVFAPGPYSPYGPVLPPVVAPPVVVPPQTPPPARAPGHHRDPAPPPDHGQVRRAVPTHGGLTPVPAAHDH
jgi:hypothetical protein